MVAARYRYEGTVSLGQSMKIAAGQP